MRKLAGRFWLVGFVHLYCLSTYWHSCSLAMELFMDIFWNLIFVTLLLCNPILSAAGFYATPCRGSLLDSPLYTILTCWCTRIVLLHVNHSLIYVYILSVSMVDIRFYIKDSHFFSHQQSVSFLLASLIIIFLACLSCF